MRWLLQLFNMTRSEFFAPLDNDLSAYAIWNWWERRRKDYNVMVIIIAVPSLLIAALCCTFSGALKLGEDFMEPIGIFFFPIAWNVCYTFGALAQMCVPTSALRRKAGPVLLLTGVIFSLIVALLPALLWFCGWMISLTTHRPPFSD
jgi:hypothetical protein